MVLGLLTLAAIPTTIGTVEAINQNKRAKREAKRDAKFALDVYCDSASRKRQQVHGKSIVLKDNKAWVYFIFFAMLFFFSFLLFFSVSVF